MEANHGVILDQIPADVGLVGGVGGDLPVLVPDGDWEPYLPVFEKQEKFGLASQNCVQFSRLNVCEMQAKFYNTTLNLSDRFLYWSSGCTALGNTFTACDFWLKARGCCPETRWPWTVPLTRAEYGVMPPGEVLMEALDLFKDWSFGMLVVVPKNIDLIKKALTYGPIWFCDSGHARVIYRVDDKLHIFDTYAEASQGKEVADLSYLNDIVVMYLAPFTPKLLIPKPMISLPRNSLVVVTDNGERLMNIDGTKLFKDEAGKILTEVIARNAVAGTSQNFPVVHVLAAEVAAIPRVNLKGENVT